MSRMMTKKCDVCDPFKKRCPNCLGRGFYFPPDELAKHLGTCGVEYFEPNKHESDGQ
jgi:hypothetical protein